MISAACEFSSFALLRAALAFAQPFPKPQPESAFADLKVQANGSPTRSAIEDWAGARERLRSDREWQSWLAARRVEVDEWIVKRRDKVEWVAGWHHDFVSPKDGSFLTWTPGEPGESLSSRVRSEGRAYAKAAQAGGLRGHE